MRGWHCQYPETRWMACDWVIKRSAVNNSSQVKATAQPGLPDYKWFCAITDVRHSKKRSAVWSQEARSLSVT
jgi:hypothetical protein